MLFIINFDIKDASRIDLFAQKLNTIGECVLFMPRCYLLKTSKGLTGSDIYGRLKSVLQDEDLFLLAQVKVEEMNGWLSTSTVEWLKNTKL